MTLDIIVPHYKEPWETGMRLFDMLALQRGVNFSSFRVIIVQDGQDGALPWDKLTTGYPYQIVTLTAPHGGVSRARNAGLAASDAEWIIFCDFDDTFSDIHSLFHYYRAMNENYDMIFSHVNNEQPDVYGQYSLTPFMANEVFIHGKMLRREFLISSGLQFEPDVNFSEDTLFCHVLRILLNPARQCEIPQNLYTRCYSENSVCHAEENRVDNAKGLFLSRKTLAREYHDRNCPKNYAGTVCKTVFDYYYATISPAYPDPEWFEQDFYSFWKEHSDTFRNADDNLKAYENDLAFHEAAHKGLLSIPSVTFGEWLKKMERKFGNGKKGARNSQKGAQEREREIE